VGVQLHSHRYRVPGDAAAVEPEIMESRAIIANLPQLVDTVATSSIACESRLSGMSALLPRRAIRINVAS